MMAMLSAQIGIAVTLGGCFVFAGLAIRAMGVDRRRAMGRMRSIGANAASTRRNRTRLTTAQPATTNAAVSFQQRVVERLKLLSSNEATVGRTLLNRAGLRNERALAGYLFSRISMPMIFGLVALLDGHLLHILPMVSRAPAVAACLATVVGFYAPVMMLNNKINRRQAELRKSLPDGIDLLVICVESGASINDAFGRVGRELARGHPALAEEFAITAAELSFLPVRRVALENLLDRTGLPAIRGLVTTMLQAERFGTPIAQSLRVLSAEFRDQRMMAAETKASKLPVLLTVPMMLFILPVLFIVLLGPAAIGIIDAMGK